MHKFKGETLFFGTSSCFGAIVPKRQDTLSPTNVAPGSYPEDQLPLERTISLSVARATWEGVYMSLWLNNT